MKTYILASFFTLLGLSISAQSASDALLVGQVYHGGSARYMAMGGAFNALGGDFSTLSVNPAGLGVYRSGELVMTMDLNVMNTTSEAMPSMNVISSPISDMKANFNLSNMGYVFNTKENSSGLINLNFGIGFNRLKNYHRSYRAEALGASHSLTDNWAISLNNGLSNATTGAFVADQAYLINTDRDPNDVNTIFSAESPLLPGVKVDYMKDVVEKGRVNEWVFSVGGNYEHMVYFGATFGIQSIDQSKEMYQTETFLNIDDPTSADDGYAYKRYETATTDRYYSATNEDYFKYYSEENTTGFGLNTKLGVIVRPTSDLRFGLAVHTPTVNFLSVDHYADLYNNTFYIPDLGGSEASGGDGLEDPDAYQYRTLSPYKLHASAAMTIGKQLAIDVEGDMVDYASMRIFGDNGRSVDFAAVNNTIDAMYKTAYNFRAGAELKLLPTLSVRGGFAYYGSPYKDNFTYNADGSKLDAADYVGDRFSYSGGIGYRAGDFFMDFAYILTKQDNRVMAYDDAIDPYEYDEIALSQSLVQCMMTVGFKF